MAHIDDIRADLISRDPHGKLAAQQETKSLLRHIDPNYIRSHPSSQAYREGWERTFGPKPVSESAVYTDEDRAAIREIIRLTRPESAYEANYDAIFGFKDGPAPVADEDVVTRDEMGHGAPGMEEIKWEPREHLGRPYPVPIVMGTAPGVGGFDVKEFCDECGREEDECVCE